jgi:hypothetical protein
VLIGLELTVRWSNWGNLLGDSYSVFWGLTLGISQCPLRNETLSISDQIKGEGLVARVLGAEWRRVWGITCLFLQRNRISLWSSSPLCLLNLWVPGTLNVNLDLSLYLTYCWLRKTVSPLPHPPLIKKDCELWLLVIGEGGSVASGIKTWEDFLLGVLAYQTYVGGTPFCRTKTLAFLTDSRVLFLTRGLQIQ